MAPRTAPPEAARSPAPAANLKSCWCQKRGSSGVPRGGGSARECRPRIARQGARSADGREQSCPEIAARHVPDPSPALSAFALQGLNIAIVGSTVINSTAGGGKGVLHGARRGEN